MSNKEEAPMGQWVKCTEFGTQKVRYFNFAFVTEIEPLPGATRLRFENGSVIDVKESAEQLLAIED
jgi:hypothetical protein